MLAADKPHDFPPGQGEQGNSSVPQGVGSVVEVNRRTVKSNRRNGSVLGDALVGLERLVGAGDPVNGIARHLAAHRWKLRSEGVVTQVVQRNPVPAPMRHHQRHDGGAGVRERDGQLRQFRGLLGCRQQFQGDGALHLGNDNRPRIALQKRSAGAGLASQAALSRPGLNTRVSRATG